jgi:hypothetical protein
MIQGIITRLAGNSSTLKGFTVTIVTALLGISIDTHRADYAWLAAYPIFVFALLDTYYLALERSYRNLYSRAASEGDGEWGLAASKLSLSAVTKSIRSPSVWGFYGAALLAIALVAAVI